MNTEQVLGVVSGGSGTGRNVIDPEMEQFLI